MERVRAGAEGVQEFLVFRLGEDLMGLPLERVSEILKPAPVTPVPRAPNDVLGILSVRGRITTIVDLRRRLRMSDSAATRHTRFLLVRGGHEVMGLRVDAVLHVVRLREGEVEHAGLVAGDLPEHVMGIGRPWRRRAASETDLEEDVEAKDAEVIVLLDPVQLLEK